VPGECGNAAQIGVIKVFGGNRMSPGAGLPIYWLLRRAGKHAVGFDPDYDP
jgi:hypothetical protein